MRYLRLGLYLIGLFTFSCVSPSNNAGYTFYEVIHRPDQLQLGDRVQVVLKEGDRIQGAVVRVGDEGITIETEGKGNRRLDWMDIRVVNRITEKAE